MATYTQPDAAPRSAADLIAEAERKRDAFEQRFLIDKGHAESSKPNACDPMDPPTENATPTGRELVRDFLFEHGLREAETELGDDRDPIMFRFLARYVVTFPEMENALLEMDIFKALKARRFEFSHIWEGVQHQPIASKATVRFLRRYLPEGSPLRDSTISEMARQLRWFEKVKDGKPRPDQRRIRNILRHYSETLQSWGVEPAVKGKPGVRRAV